MSYASGFMMGTAIVQGLGQILGGMAAQDMGRGMRPGMGRGKGMGKGGSWNSGDFRLPELRLPDARVGSMRLVAAMPGRRRYRVAGMTRKQAELLEAGMKKLSCVKEVRANALSQSLLLVYDAAAEEAVEELAKSLEKRFFGRGYRVPADGGEGMAESHAGAVTRSVRGTMRAFSAWLKAQTNGWLDVSALASLLFFFQGIRKMLENQQLPSGSQMFWWAVSLMRGWRTV